MVSSKAEGGYVVSSPVLPELHAEGATPEEALSNARAAIGAVLDLYEEQGRELPGHFH
jgi:predicted RNase H-like HicB family nuclease